MHKRYDEITGAELLRVDIKSQQITIEKGDELNNETALVSPAQFWGLEPGRGLYFDYLDEENTGWSIEKSGWNDFSLDVSAQMNPRQTDNWIRKNVFRNNGSTLTVIQGYAGCGKTIFVNSLLRRYAADDVIGAKENDVYVDYDNNSSENGYLVNAICNKTAKLLTQLMKQEVGLCIYETFVNYLGRYAIEQSASFDEVVQLFHENGQISTLLRQLYNNRSDINAFSSLEGSFQRQFICGTVLLARKANRVSVGSHINILGIKDNDEALALLLEYYTAMYLLLLHACDVVNNTRPTVVFFDNLDIIDNPQHVARLITKLQSILSKMQDALLENDRPVINVILTVRKISFAIIARFMEVENSARGRFVPAKFLDISNLYSATKLLKHKATILKNNINDYIPANYRKDTLVDFFDAIIHAPDDALNEISISDLFNHNIRACANVLYRVVQHTPQQNGPIEGREISKHCNYSVWLHNICAVLQENDIWSSLEFSTHNKDDVCFPASLSRLLLTILYNKRKDYRYHRNYVTDVEVSLDEIANLLCGLPYIVCNKRASRRNKAKDAIYYFSEDNSKESIINAITQMLKRNISDPKHEEELWRRPLYFTQNAFPLVDKKGNETIKDELEKQFSAIMQSKPIEATSFCITDEGYTFIDKIVTSFEFFSVRVNGNQAIPLFYIYDEKTLDRIIENVYSLVKETVSDHLWLMDYYIEKYTVNGPNMRDRVAIINDYLRKEYHPKTEGNHPQMHVVRTIFEHIYALNFYRDYLIQKRPDNFTALNRCIVKWIGKYLDLYLLRFYKKLDGTVGSFNKVFLDLKYLYWLVRKDENLLAKDSKGEFYISIERNNPSDERRVRQKEITDEQLVTIHLLLS